jgi:hypothetical protein
MVFVFYGHYFCAYKNKFMDVNLALKLDKLVIEKAKEYASCNKRSLSRIIESYLRSLIFVTIMKTNLILRFPLL